MALDQGTNALDASVASVAMAVEGATGGADRLWSAAGAGVPAELVPPRSAATAAQRSRTAPDTGYLTARQIDELLSVE